MGYLKALPSDLIMTFGSGTGLSGFTDIFSVLFLSSLGISQGKVFILNCKLIYFIGIFVSWFICYSILYKFFVGWWQKKNILTKRIDLSRIIKCWQRRIGNRSIKKWRV